MSYTIDHAAVRQVAADVFGIIGPVHIERVKKRRVGERQWFNMRERDQGQGVTFWRERGDAEYIEHRIRLDSDLGPYRAGTTLAHELKHLQQIENIILTTEDPEPYEPVLAFLSDGHYWDRPCEVEARAAGKTLGARLARVCFRPR